MKTRDKIVIASIANGNGVRVYVPERCQIARKLYAQRYTFLMAAATAPIFQIFGSLVAEFRIQCTSDEVSTIEPFTMSLLDRYLYVAAGKVSAKSKPESRKQKICFSDITDETIDPKHADMYATTVAKSPDAWQKAIFSLGDADTTYGN